MPTIHGTVSIKSNVFRYYIVLTELQRSVNENRTQVKIESVLAATNTAYRFDTVSSRTMTISVDGTVVASASERIDCDPWTSNPFTVQTWTGWIDHNDDGTRSVAVSGMVDGTAANYGPGVCTASGVVDLSTIPRASSVSATDANIGSVSSIMITRYSSQFVHSIYYRFGSAAWTQITDRTAESSVAWRVPESTYALIPSAKTIRCSIRCITYSGSEQIGEAQTTMNCTAAEADCAPLLSVAAADINPATLALTGNGKRIVRGQSNVRVQSTGTAQKSASITSIRVSCGDGKSGTGSDVTLTSVESAAITVYATDSRGYTTSKTVSGLTLIPYVKVSAIAEGARTGTTDATVSLNVSGNYDKTSFSASSNPLSLSYRKKEKGGTYGDPVFISPTLTETGYRAEQTLSGFDYRKDYVIEVNCSDALTVASSEIPIFRGTPLFDWGETDFRFHIPVYADSDAEADDALVRLSQARRLAKTPAEASLPFTASYQKLVQMQQIVVYTDRLDLSDYEGTFTDPTGGYLYAVGAGGSSTDMIILLSDGTVHTMILQDNDSGGFSCVNPVILDGYYRVLFVRRTETANGYYTLVTMTKLG